MRRQLPSSSLKDAFDVCQNGQRFSFLLVCPCTAQHSTLGKSAPSCSLLRCVLKWLHVFLFFLLLLRFAQTLASDLAVAKHQEEVCHCLSPPPPATSPHYLTTVLPTWGLGTDVRAGVPSPAHAIHGAAVVKGATTYHIWREGGRTLLPPPLLTHSHRGVINWTAVPLQYPPPDSLTHTQSRSSADLVSSSHRGMIKPKKNARKCRIFITGGRIGNE